MNILASYNWIKEYLKTDLSAEEFAKKTTAAGNGVERIHDIGAGLDSMVVGLVKVVKAHPNANKLRIAEVDIGLEVVEIVCGGVNLADGQKVAVALPGSMVRWHGQGDLVEIKETELRGAKSYGMICAAAEIGFEKLPAGDHDIWDLSSITDAKAGTPLAKALGLDDVIFDIEVTSNRPDCKSIVGQALEGAAATGGKFTLKMPPAIKEGSAKLKVSVKDFELCRKYEAVLIEGVKVGPSPWWVQKKLLLAGHRPINNVVDVTNLVLHELGQPMHAFDADKLEGGELIVRRAKKDEVMKALDGKDYDLTEKMLVIADENKPVAIAGVMGGMETGTTAATTRVILEAATFDPVSVRRTSRALNLTSDSSLLFEKGLSTEATHIALSRAVELILDIAGGKVASKVWSDQAAPYKAPVFAFDPAEASRLIGVDILEKKQVAMLGSLGFKIGKKGKAGYAVTVPFWRDHDIEGSRDFVEEIARLYGYANVPSKLPEGELPDTTPDPSIVWERRAKDILKGSGVTETYAYSFVSPQQLERYAIPLEQAVKISNPLSSEQEYMRPSLIPTMLTAIEANQAMFPDMALFELAPTYLPNTKDIPTHALRLVVSVVGKDGYAAFRNAKGILERLMRELGIKRWRLERDAKDERWHAGRSAVISVGDHQDLGVIGEISPSIAKAFGIDGRVVLIDLDFESLVPMCSTAKSYHPIPMYPEVKRDLAFVVADRTEFSALEAEMKKSASLLHSVELFDIYRGKGVEEGKKSMAAHLMFRSNDKTLETNEVDAEMKTLGDVIMGKFGGILRA